MAILKAEGNRSRVQPVLNNGVEALLSKARLAPDPEIAFRRFTLQLSGILACFFTRNYEKAIQLYTGGRD